MFKKILGAIRPKGVIFITAGQRPAVRSATFFCLKGRTYAGKVLPFK
jgi:hypothetical protein